MPGYYYDLAFGTYFGNRETPRPSARGPPLPGSVATCSPASRALLAPHLPPLAPPPFLPRLLPPIPT